MAFTMSYGVTPTPALAETIPKPSASKRPALHRGRKHDDSQNQAQAMVDPTLAQISEEPLRVAATDGPEDGAPPRALSEEPAAQDIQEPLPA